MRVTVQQARQILGDDSLSDEEIQEIIDDLYQFAVIVTDSYFQEKQQMKDTTTPRQPEDKGSNINEP